MKKITREQFNAIAKLLQIKSCSSARMAAYSVIVDGESIECAAKALGMRNADARIAVERIVNALELAKIAADKTE
ncbi:MAG: hypothetical protein U5M23_01460 [Marinagarivorans sp.]|nr:hypothetical protein [Marinagarivorans sp.]